MLLAAWVLEEGNATRGQMAFVRFNDDIPALLPTAHTETSSETGWNLLWLHNGLSQRFSLKGWSRGSGTHFKQYVQLQRVLRPSAVWMMLYCIITD